MIVETHGRASLRSLNRNHIKAGNHEVDIRPDHPIVMGQGSQIKAEVSAINDHRIDAYNLSIAAIGSSIVGHGNQLLLLIPIAREHRFPRNILTINKIKLDNSLLPFREAARVTERPITILPHLEAYIRLSGLPVQPINSLNDCLNSFHLFIGSNYNVV